MSSRHLQDQQGYYTNERDNPLKVKSNRCVGLPGGSSDRIDHVQKHPQARLTSISPLSRTPEQLYYQRAKKNVSVQNPRPVPNKVYQTYQPAQGGYPKKAFLNLDEDQFDTYLPLNPLNQQYGDEPRKTGNSESKFYSNNPARSPNSYSHNVLQGHTQKTPENRTTVVSTSPIGHQA